MSYLTSKAVDELLIERPALKKQLIDILARGAQLLEPLPTGETFRGKPASPPRAVFFDIYGTLIISQSGDVGSAKAGGKQEVFRQALAAVGIAPLRDDQADLIHDNYFSEILESHQRSRAEGIEAPEVDIITIWHRVLEKTLMEQGFSLEITAEFLARLAIEYEIRSNAAAPMPGAGKLLEHLKIKKIPRGIISNAQFYTPLLIEAFFGKSPEDLGFSPDLLFWSYREGCGKPSALLFKRARKALEEREITDPSTVVYLGNDVAKDIIPSRKEGFSAALFAGDIRSLRWGEKDPLYSYLKPDIIVTELDQLTSFF
jgi:putative hydrolase of the HAD superfamily